MAKKRKNNLIQKAVLKSRKRKKNKRRSRLPVIILLVLCIIIVTLFFNRYSIMLARKGYSKEDRSILLKMDKEDIKEYLDLDQALDLSIWDEYDNAQHYYDYYLYQKASNADEQTTIQYIDSFYEIMDDLEQLGYTKDYLRSIYHLYSVDDFKVLITNSISYDDASKYIEVKGCQLRDMPSYLASGLSEKEAVMQVTYSFIDSSKGASQITYKITEPENIDTLIKAGFTVGSDYEPDDLVDVDLPLSNELTSAQLREEAANALIQMAEDAKEEGLTIGIRSAYRSYSDQEAVYNEYMNEYGYEYASQLVSVPGSSEHQLGLGVDLTSQSVIDGTYGSFDQTDEYTWTLQNAYKYGFILRYPSDKTTITGSMNEPWHYRYVGTEIAKECTENNWTLEEYIQQKGFSYDLIIQ